MATLDPNPLVNGKGLSELEDAGLSVHLNECGEEARQVAEAYTKFVATGPSVRDGEVRNELGR